MKKKMNISIWCSVVKGIQEYELIHGTCFGCTSACINEKSCPKAKLRSKNFQVRPVAREKAF